MESHIQNIERKKNCQPKFLYPVKLYFRNKRMMRFCRTNKKKLREFGLRRNAKGNFLSGSNNTLINVIKTYEGTLCKTGHVKI